MSDYPRDRFDALTDDLARVGAHRAPMRRGRGWIVFAWAALATGLLVGAGVLALGRIEAVVAGSGQPAVTAAAPTARPTVDTRLRVVVLNGTATSGLAKKAGDRVSADGWTVQSVTNASATTVKTTTVYYAERGQAGAAAGLARSLGLSRTERSDRFAPGGTNRLTVVLGADWAAKRAD